MTVERGTRVRLSVAATVAGWLAALLVSLWYEAPQLWRNGGAPYRAHEFLLGLAAWTGFTLAVCAAVWCVVVLPVALAAPAAWLLGHRRALLRALPLAAYLFIGWRLETWQTLLFEHPEQSPLKSLLFWNYAIFAAVFAWTTAWMYLRLLRRSANRAR